MPIYLGHGNQAMKGNQQMTSLIKDAWTTRLEDCNTVVDTMMAADPEWTYNLVSTTRADGVNYYAVEIIDEDGFSVGRYIPKYS